MRTLHVIFLVICGLNAAIVWPRMAESQPIAGTKASADLVVPPPVPQHDDPGTDGWHTEVFHNAAAAQLKQIGKLLQDPEQITVAHVAPLVTSDFVCDRLRPAKTRLVFEDCAITVLRGDDPIEPSDGQYRGTAGFAAVLRDLADLFTNARNTHFQFKIFRTEESPTGTTSRQYFSMNGHRTIGSLEVHATWDCQWTTSGTGGRPQLRSIALRDYEQTRIRVANTTLFSDCTKAVLGRNDCFDNQLMRGLYDWMGQIEYVLTTDNLGGYQGLAVADVNGDGLQDVYLCQTGGLPNRLFVQNEDGTATDRSAQGRVDWLDRTLGSLLVDLDNDGDQDLVLGTWLALVVMSNDGTGVFETQYINRNVRVAYSLTAADYDHDGDLDLYACRYNPDYIQSGHVPNPIPYHDANNGAANFLLRNDGNWQFRDATKASGLDANNRRWSFAASWEDVDNDGDPDLYVANDFGRNCLYRNDGGHFVNIAKRAGVEDLASGMSVSFADYNRDGLMDIYVGNMFSSAGSRITFQNGFQPGAAPATRAHYQRLARGNSLFAANGDGTFTDVSVAYGVTMGHWSWASVFADLNNDGWEDLVVANGFITAPDTGDL